VYPWAAVRAEAPAKGFAAQAKGGPCAEDAEKFCKDVAAGGGRRAKCLKEHESELSEACKKQVASAQVAAEWRQACKSDIEKLCKGIQPGGGRFAKCLKEHESDLSADCKTAMKK
jgi:hypothetical protein